MKEINCRSGIPQKFLGKTSTIAQLEPDLYLSKSEEGYLFIHRKPHGTDYDTRYGIAGEYVHSEPNGLKRYQHGKYVAQQYVHWFDENCWWSGKPTWRIDWSVSEKD